MSRGNSFRFAGERFLLPHSSLTDLWRPAVPNATNWSAASQKARSWQTVWPGVPLQNLWEINSHTSPCCPPLSIIEYHIIRLPCSAGKARPGAAAEPAFSSHSGGKSPLAPGSLLFSLQAAPYLSPGHIRPKRRPPPRFHAPYPPEGVLPRILPLQTGPRVA
jgi:hypothetical protein